MDELERENCIVGAASSQKVSWKENETVGVEQTNEHDHEGVH